MVIVLCGSMKFKGNIISLKDELEALGHVVKLPIECINGEPKIMASRAHFNRIVDEETDAIVVVNQNKNDLKNYIGPNTFAEIAFAFFHNKKIFILNDIYEPFKDELEGWNAIALGGKIENIK